MIRPTKTTSGRSGSIPIARTASAAAGEVSRTQPAVSIPLCTTWTRSGSMSGYDRRMSARIPPLTAMTAWAPTNAVRSQNDDTA